MSRYFLLILFVASVYNIGCKKINSNLASLENFAGGGLKYNRCSAGPDRSLLLKSFSLPLPVNIEINDENLSKRLLEQSIVSLSSLPLQMQKLLIRLNTKIRVSDQLPVSCGLSVSSPAMKDFLQEGKLGLTGCQKIYFQRKDNDQEFWSNEISKLPINNNTPLRLSRIDIILGANEVAVQHALVRQVGLVLSQVIPRIHINKKTNTYEYLPNRTPSFVLERNLLTKSFFEDLSSGVFPTSEMAKYIGPNMFPKVTQNIAAVNSGQNIDIFSGVSMNVNSNSQRPIRKENLKDFIFAESFDSYYCNSWFPNDQNIVADIKKTKNLDQFKNLHNSRDTFKNFFPKSFEAYNQINNRLMKIADSLAPVASQSPSSFSLAEDDESSEEQPLTEQDEETWGEWAGRWSKNLDPSAYIGAAGDKVATTMVNNDIPGASVIAATGGFFTGISDMTSNIVEGSTTLGAEVLTEGPIDTYNKLYYQPTYQKSEKIANNLEQGGADYGNSLYDQITLVGATSLPGRRTAERLGGYKFGTPEKVDNSNWTAVLTDVNADVLELSSSALTVAKIPTTAATLSNVPSKIAHSYGTLTTQGLKPTLQNLSQRLRPNRSPYGRDTVGSPSPIDKFAPKDPKLGIEFYNDYEKRFEAQALAQRQHAQDMGEMKQYYENVRILQKDSYKNRAELEKLGFKGREYYGVEEVRKRLEATNEGVARQEALKILDDTLKGELKPVELIAGDKDALATSNYANSMPRKENFAPIKSDSEIKNALYELQQHLGHTNFDTNKLIKVRSQPLKISTEGRVAELHYYTHEAAPNIPLWIKIKSGYNLKDIHSN